MTLEVIVLGEALAASLTHERLAGVLARVPRQGVLAREFHAANVALADVRAPGAGAAPAGLQHDLIAHGGIEEG